MSENQKTELNEAWGKNSRFGFVQIAKNNVYWYGLKTGIKAKGFSENYFKEFHPTIRNIINKTAKENIFTAEITDLKPTNNWHKETICLIGDASHATTPNLGQGACQAIEDAYVLATCLGKYDAVLAFEKFKAIRLPKAHKVVKTSWIIGKMAHLSNPLLVWLRNSLLQITPTSINRKQSEYIFKIPSL